MKKTVVLIFFLLCAFLSFSQNTIGIPDIINYTKSHYNAGPPNWDIVQDKNGIVYFANSEGLLSFDGVYWKTYTLPGKAMARSLAIGKDNKIYIGSQDDFGFFSPDKTGRLQYTSLKPLVPEKHRSFAGVWDIVLYEDDIFFRCEAKIFQLSNGSINVYPAASGWRFLGPGNNRLIAQDFKNGLLEFNNGVWSPFVKESDLQPGYQVSALAPFGNDSLLISTLKNGLFVLHNERVSRFNFPGQNPFANELILSCLPVNEDWMAIGTQLNGCYIINKNGEIIQNISRKEGLQNNCVLALYLDKNYNLWMGLDNGVDFTAYNNAIKHIYPEQLNEGAGYSSLIFKNELYIGTSNRLYKIPLTGKKDLSFLTGTFEPLPDTRGASWGLYDVNGHLLVAHHEGSMEIKDGRVIPLNKQQGYWTYLPFYNVLPSSLVVAGNYSGIDFFRFENNSFTFQGKLPGLNDGVRFAAIDNDGIIWVAHTFRGVFKIDITDIKHPVTKLYTDKNGLPSAVRNQLFKVKNRIVVATEKGIYEYNARNDTFETSSYFKSFFGNRNIRYLKEDKEGNIWFVEGKSLGVIDLSGPKAKIIYFPEIKGRLVNNFENINPIDKYNVLVGADKGFYHINYKHYKKTNSRINVQIGTVKSFGKKDSLLFGGYFGDVNDSARQSKESIPEIAFGSNSVHLEYASALNAHQSSVEYSYYLEGFDKDWSDWSKKTEKDYTNLPAGTYTFRVKAKSNLGNESAISSYSFSVLPPWYQTYWAYILYGLAGIGIVYLVYLQQRKKLKKQQQRHELEQKRLQYLHQLELEKTEKELVTLKNEKLQVEIEHKNTELASVAMHLVQKGELLGKIKEELVRLKNGSNGNGHANSDLKKLIHKLGEEDKMDKDWEHFAIHFDKVHSDFLKNLKAAYPNLSANELKLSAYLLMNLSSKEIARLMNISVRGVEISRYRLRKKFQLPTETNLFNFLLEFSTSHSTQNGNGAGSQ